MKYYKSKTVIYVNGRPVGSVQDGVLKKSLSSSKHFLKKPEAICLDTDSLKDAERAGAQWVEIRDRDSGLVYVATCSTIHQRGFSVNRGYGEQVALCLEYWQKDGFLVLPIENRLEESKPYQLVLL